MNFYINLYNIIISTLWHFDMRDVIEVEPKIL